MLTVISPAKKLNDAPHEIDGIASTQPAFLTEANRLAKIARALSSDELGALMGISDTLSALNRERFRAFGQKNIASPAAFLFNGDTYAGLDARTMEPDTLRWAQGHLRILSGLYGILRPLDLIQPYRLEMGSRLANPKGKDLYAFWGNQIAQAINAQAAETGATALLNCASTEYFSAVSQKTLALPIITPVFLEERNGEAKVVSFWAKKARGAMARFACQHHLTDPTDLRSFDLGGYQFRPNLSDLQRLVFSRNAPPAVAA